MGRTFRRSRNGLPLSESGANSNSWLSERGVGVARSKNSTNLNQVFAAPIGNLSMPLLDVTLPGRMPPRGVLEGCREGAVGELYTACLLRFASAVRNEK